MDHGSLFCRLLIPILVLVIGAAASAADSPPRPGCATKCGAVDIPYPFGIGDSSCFMEGFDLTCNETLKKLFVGNVEVAGISVPLGQIRMLYPISWQCYDVTTKSVKSSSTSLEMTNTPFRFSDVHNKFTVIGCHTVAFFLAYQSNKNESYTGGCVSMCGDKQSIVNGTCTGRGCCQTTDIPKDLRYYEVWFAPDYNNSDIWSFSSCSYAVLREADSFEFLTSYISPNQTLGGANSSLAPVVVDWAIGNQTCAAAQGHPSSYACVSKNSRCIDSSNGPGYLCNCSAGYQGNPYLKEGCNDIDECDPANTNPCSGGICKNLQGSYTCSCPGGTHWDPYNGTCTPDHTPDHNPDQKLPLSVKVAIGTSGLAFVFFCSTCICMIAERRKRLKDRERYFREHGGRLLLEEIKEKEGLAFKIFTKEELEKATDKFDQNQVLGRGGHATVYKGVLQDRRIVAIKKSKVIDENQKEEFGKEMLILSQINHRNIVKLLGCCLEVEVPMLVYEFISNGTLFGLIHNNSNVSSLSLTTRLRIASESADALAYLHSSASPPIIHGDVKTSNILLDENYNAKISDFGASKLIPKDEDQFATLVQGTCGYLDPEYLQKCQLTDKSDVYSFGVVLLELLTGRKAIYFEGSEEEGRSLASSFFLALNENRFPDILDRRVKEEGDGELIEELSELIKRCLDLKGDGRPTMKEVMEELDKLRKFQQHPWIPQNSEEIMSLLSEEPSAGHGAGVNYEGKGMDTTTCYNAEKGYALDIESGR